MTADPDPRLRASTHAVGIADYLRGGALLALYSGALVFVTGTATGQPLPPERLIAPIGALVAMTGFVCLLMLVVRNATILSGITKITYYRDYLSEIPPEWVERPARTFNNLLQVPVLFYTACLLMMVIGRVDGIQLTLAWHFVALRGVHAIIYIAWNHVPYRLVAWFAGCITLGVIWTRILAHA